MAAVVGDQVRRLTSEEAGDPESLTLGDLDITTENLSLAGIEKEIEAFADSEVLRAILDQGGDPKAFSRQYETKLRQAELESIQDYISESDNLQALHSQIKECDDILAAMEGMLGRFQGDLGNISSEIRTLQEQSQSMSVKLKNRKVMQEKLEHFIDNIAIPPSLIHSIMQADIGEEFLQSLQQLSNKLEFVEKDDLARFSAAYRDVAPELERLRVKAIARCRDFLMERFYDFRKPKTNVQIKQNVLLKYKYMIQFLRHNSKDIFAEVRAAYVDKISGKIGDLFRGYWTLMDRLEEHVVTQADLIGAPEAAATSGGMMSFFQRAPGAGGPAAGQRSEPYQLRDRAGLLAQLEAAPLILHVAESEGKKFPYEVLFRSLQKLLMDTAAHEYLFCCDFWGEDSVYQDLFQQVLAFVETSLSAILQEMYDPIALLLMIRVNRENTLAMNRRRVPALDAHFDRVNLLLWPRLKTLFDLQLNSIKQLPAAPADNSPRLQLLTERYAHFTASVLLLHADFIDGPLEANIERLRYSVMNLLLNMSRHFTPKGRGTVFLIVNFSYVVMVLKNAHSRGLPLPPNPNPATGTEATGLGPAGLAVLKEFEDSLARCTSIYVEEGLQKTVPNLVTFVKRAESAAAQMGGAEGQLIPGFGPSEGSGVARDFTNRWQAAVESINRDVSKDFGSTTTGRTVLQAAFTQLLLYYNRFLELLKRQGAQGLAVVKDAVPMPTIMYGLKQYNR
ncbi:hypothetical protein N2152v2_009275 [Parachlorella kessleri]